MTFQLPIEKSKGPWKKGKKVTAKTDTATQGEVDKVIYDLQFAGYDNEEIEGIFKKFGKKFDSKIKELARDGYSGQVGDGR